MLDLKVELPCLALRKREHLRADNLAALAELEHGDAQGIAVSAVVGDV